MCKESRDFVYFFTSKFGSETYLCITQSGRNLGGFTRWFWLSACHDTAVETLARVLSSESFVWLEHLLPGSLPWLAEGLCSLSCRLPMQCSLTQQLASFQVIVPRKSEQKGRGSVFCLISEVAHHHFRHSPFVTQTSLVQLGRRLHRGQGSSGATLKAVFHNRVLNGGCSINACWSITQTFHRSKCLLFKKFTLFLMQFSLHKN